METIGRAVRAKKRFRGIHAVGGAGRGPPRPRGPCDQLAIADCRLTITHSFTTVHGTLFEGER